jgi:hypothetical protein
MHHDRGTRPAAPAPIRPAPNAGHWRRPNEYRRGEHMTAAIETHERWVTKQQLADHLQVTRRWIELQQHHGLPHLRMGGMNRYILSEVEAWLHERYATTEDAENT